MPSRWTSSPRPASQGGVAGPESAIATCLGVPSSQLAGGTLASVASPDFHSPDGTQTISSSVTYLKDADVAHQRQAAINGPKVPACIGASLHDALASKLSVKFPDAKVGAPVANRRAFPATGEEITAYRVALPVSVSGHESWVGADLLFIRKGRVEVTLSFETMASPVPNEEEQHYAEVVVSRVVSQGSTT